MGLFSLRKTGVESQRHPANAVSYFGLVTQYTTVFRKKD